MGDVSPVPDGYGTVTPWIIVRGCAAFLDFLQAAFGAEEIARLPQPDGTIGHAEVRIGDSVVMSFDAADDWPDTPAFLRLFVPDADAAQRQAVAAGAVSVTEVTELFFGHRVGRVRDPWGNVWWIQTQVAELTPEELGRRAGEPAAMEAMRYVQESLRTELGGRRQP